MSRRDSHFGFELAAERRLVAVAAIECDVDEAAVRVAQGVRGRFDTDAGEQLPWRYIQDTAHEALEAAEGKAGFIGQHADTKGGGKVPSNPIDGFGKRAQARVGRPSPQVPGDACQGDDLAIAVADRHLVREIPPVRAIGVRYQF